MGRRDRDDGRAAGSSLEEREALDARARRGRSSTYRRSGRGRRELAGRYGDGLWTLGDPEQAPEIIDAYRESCREHGREEGEIIFQAGFAWADDEQAAIDGARHWKPTQLPELYLEDIADQDDMQRRADAQMSDEQFAKEGFLIASDPGEHVERIREMERAGATVVCLQLIGRADPLGSIRTYGERVLPALRGATVGS